MQKKAMIAWIPLIILCFELDLPFSFFYVDQFHLFMPVKGNDREIKRDRTWIYIKWKQAASMLFRFLILCAVLFFSHVSGTSCNRFFKSK